MERAESEHGGEIRNRQVTDEAVEEVELYTVRERSDTRKQISRDSSSIDAASKFVVH